MNLSYITNKGKTANNQEDAVLIGKTILQKNMTKASLMRDDFSILAVSDGIAGLRYGEVASKEALNFLSIHMQNTADIKLAIRQTQKSLSNYAFKNRKFYDMGATLAGVYFFENKAFVFNVGDSRIYIYRDNNLQMLSIDHTVARKMVLKGELKNQYDCADMYKMLDSAIIANDEADDFDIHSLEIECTKEDKFLICTDGLTDMLDDKTVADTFNNLSDVRDIANALFKQAMTNGGLDNLSLVVCNI